MHFRLQTATDCRLTVPDASGNQGELNSCTKLCFAAAPRHSRIPRFVSTAAAQQQMATSNKNAKTKKEPSAGQLAARERQKKYAAEWKEAKAAGKIEKGAT
jgi:hypothetical protein